MSDHPLVSVIIPSYNHARYVAGAIESVLAQTYPNLELIVIDDGSKDNSHEVISGYADDPRVTVILNTENRGQSYVINRALEMAKGEFISLLPSDDWYLPRKTELQVAKFFESGLDIGVVYAAGERFFEDTGESKRVILPIHTGWIAEKLIREGNFVYPVTPLFRREVFAKAPPHEGFKAEGEAVYLRIALHYQFEYVDEVVAVMRDHNFNIGKNVGVMYDQLAQYWDWFFDLPEVPDGIKRLKPVAIEKMNRVKGLQFIGDKRDFRRGRRCLLAAVRSNPVLLVKPKILAGLVISLLPAPLANYLLDRRLQAQAAS